MATTSAFATLGAVLGITVLFMLMLYGLVVISRAWKSYLKNRLIYAIKRRRNTGDTFREDNGYSWDYVMVFRVYDEDDHVTDKQIKYNMRHILHQLGAGGLETRLFYSMSRKEVFCKIRCPLTRMQKHADLVDYKLILDRDALRELCLTGRDGLWEPLKIPDHSEVSSLNPYEFIYARYEFDQDTSRTDPNLVKVYKRWNRIDLTVDGVLKLDEPENDTPIRNPMADSTPSPIAVESGGEGEELEPLKNESHMFRGVDRLKLIHSIITYKGPGGCMLDPDRLEKDDCILAYFPLHDLVELRELEYSWLLFLQWPWNQPTDKIRNYYGEKIGLYFKWLGLYESWLILAAIVGFFMWIAIAADDNNPNAETVPYFAGFMALWSALFLEHWKRTEITAAMEWGTVGFEDEEQERPNFEGETELSAVNGRPEKYFSGWERWKRNFLNQNVIFALTLLVIAELAIIFTIEEQIALVDVSITQAELAMIISALMVAVGIIFFNYLFGHIALQLNDYENHRTDTEFEDALISKTFSFQFVNSYACLFYIAFFKPYIPNLDPCVGQCMSELQVFLGVIFLSRLLIGNMIELGFPLIRKMAAAFSRRNALARRRAADASQQYPDFSDEGVELHSIIGDGPGGDQRNDVSEIEVCYSLDSYDEMMGTFEDYSEMALQFGYTTMFVAAFPLATVCSFINNYVEIRVDAWKLCQLSRRPEPRSAEDIGTWFSILELTSLFATFINSALVAFTGTNTINYTWAERVWVFILMAGGLFMIRLYVEYLVPDVPMEVTIQMKRQEYILGKVLDNVEDEDDSDLMKNVFEVPDYLIKQTDEDPM